MNVDKTFQICRIKLQKKQRAIRRDVHPPSRPDQYLNMAIDVYSNYKNVLLISLCGNPLSLF